MDTVISKIKKNALEEIWISLREYKGHEFLDIRCHIKLGDGGAPQPTHKGVAISPALLNDLRESLAKFLQPDIDSSTVFAITKNKREHIHISRDEYMGRQLFNIRVFFVPPDGSEAKPTRKGIAFSVNLVSEVIRAVDLAIRYIAEGKFSNTGSEADSL